MSLDLIERLNELGNLGDYNPPDFDYFRSLGEVVHHQRLIERILETKLELDQDVQDSTHFTELLVLSEPLQDRDGHPNSRKVLLGIRFSSFGRLVAVSGFELEKWAVQLPKLRDYLSKAGYEVLPSEVLEADGGKWFQRFFDYQ